MGNAIPLGPGAGVMGDGVIVGLWPGIFPTGMNEQEGGWERWLKSKWSGSQSLGSNADSADETCCEALVRFSLWASVSSSVKWDQS